MKKWIVVFSALVTATCSDGQTGTTRQGSVTTCPSNTSGCYYLDSSGNLIGTSSTLSIAGTTSTASTLTMASTSGYILNCQDSMGRIYACGGGPSYETRKDDGKGPTLLQVKNSAKKFTANELPPVDYVKIARSAGIDSPSPIVDEARIMNMIDGLGLKVYSFDKVDNYLYRKALKQGTNMRWVWKPVRAKDDNYAIKHNDRAVIAGVGMVYDKMYAQQIPINVLKLMKEMDCEMSDVMFLVSDYEVVKPDPFLAITTQELLNSGKIWIVAQWDEPGFKDGPELQASR